MRFLVTGATGFVGSEFCELAQVRGHSLLRVSRRAPEVASAEVVVADLEAAPDLSAVLAGVDVVVHLAARVHSMREDADDLEVAYRAANTEVTRRLAEQAAAAGVRRFVFVSSIKAMAERSPGRALTEADAPAPEDPYGRSKLLAEQVLREVAEAHGMEWVVLRPTLVFGAGVGGNFARLLSLVDRGLPLPLGRAQALRSFINVWNFADLIERCCVHPAAAGQIFLAADCCLGTAELIRALGHVLQRPLRLLPVPMSWLDAWGRMLGMRGVVERLTGELRVDAGHAREVLGWQPRISLEDALQRTARAWREASGR
ncbi:MAG: hypothetical protein CGU28_05910 [Candidatus Dactylopiibacterium carminicum]|uniref:NAD-dependent epimerase/dehydratase domain-containing protein n=1 Tax=Candidatus Dactylopiibacterium carminicum TaxID=857335 RepID=A0A272EQQ4_9RHOO|nr:NAD-dependent epimerase/dehydratase family protein [Candidatus Dactylopiibacterium carminicum]KAF7599288.1 hypothetical protein BGI27_08910 [Candidatus Dactylopiibacterium carminicum]PAS92449.1 MAG: hypothetical protein CGU29_11630 [Candidatus Dactylopiibacterium carminicum]PAS97162.1 MAG: hypothetical protein CGU28_05910 [Candidatus Dactylopiibacterium carminicum]PAS99293.1 MAG: hypothetical protein BSR46_08945 [Candidatus Dactylopiibacterium carminicum]